jgi:hypothetical protein
MAIEKLGINAKDIMDKSNPLYQDAIKGRDPDWIFYKKTDVQLIDYAAKLWFKNK